MCFISNSVSHTAPPHPCLAQPLAFHLHALLPLFIFPLCYPVPFTPSVSSETHPPSISLWHMPSSPFPSLVPCIPHLYLPPMSCTNTHPLCLPSTPFCLLSPLALCPLPYALLIPCSTSIGSTSCTIVHYPLLA